MLLKRNSTGDKSKIYQKPKHERLNILFELKVVDIAF